MFFFVKEHAAENLMVGCGRSASLHNVFAARTKTSWSTVSSEDDQPEMSEVSEKHELLAEVSRLIDIIINSFYSDKQMLLREDRTLRTGRSSTVCSTIHSSATSRTSRSKSNTIPMRRRFSIIDSGIGMSKADLINNLGKLPRGHGRWILRLRMPTLRSL